MENTPDDSAGHARCSQARGHATIRLYSHSPADERLVRINIASVHQPNPGEVMIP